MSSPTWLQLVPFALVSHCSSFRELAGQLGYGTTTNCRERDHDGLAVWRPMGSKRLSSVFEGWTSARDLGSGPRAVLMAPHQSPAHGPTSSPASAGVLEPETGASM
jgi:hypothetical protein